MDRKLIDRVDNEYSSLPLQSLPLFGQIDYYCASINSSVPEGQNQSAYTLMLIAWGIKPGYTVSKMQIALLPYV